MGTRSGLCWTAPIKKANNFNLFSQVDFAVWLKYSPVPKQVKLRP